MAESTNIEADSSSDESTVIVAQTGSGGLEPYQFEPKQQSGEESASELEQSESSEESEAEAESENRLNSTNWCSCDRCSVDSLRREKECRCCLDKRQTKEMAKAASNDEFHCVTKHPDFTLLCLTPAVLRNVLVGLNNVRADRWEVNPPQNSGFRYAAYRQFVWWIHGKLGPGRRRVIPACATHSIRQTFPKADGEEYKGFISGEESESD